MVSYFLSAVNSSCTNVVTFLVVYQSISRFQRKTMIGIALILGITSITICYANANVENELMEIRTILIHQKREIKALRNENRVLRADVRKMAVEIDNLKKQEQSHAQN